jgi:hypothetical protein
MNLKITSVSGKEIKRMVLKCLLKKTALLQSKVNPESSVESMLETNILLVEAKAVQLQQRKYYL